MGTPARRYSENEDKEILRLRDEQRMTFPAIAAAIGRENAECVWSRYRLLVAKRADHRPTSQRYCRTCGQPFQSQGNHNRMCDPCREGAADMSPWDIAYAVAAPERGAGADL